MFIYEQKGNMSNLKELEMQGCKTFVCPNLSLMEEKCKESNIREDIIERSKSMAIEYFRKTYHEPHYSSARHVIPAIVYIACCLEGDKRSKTDIAKMFDTSHITVRKWQIDIMEVLDIKTLETNRKFKKIEVDIDGQFCEIDKEGNVLLLKEDTIETAKCLLSKYFKIESFDRHYSRIRQLRLAIIYTASIVENDRRTQIEICQISGISEAVISNWYRKVLRVLGLKIICNNGHTVTVLEGQYDS
jgi:transcription initiation factor TFIIIB Brf1 subunit/transcription initiation factor TFIIB